eukprot:CAMPEP_0195129456 /NCGR_PEP_ID=MMETSP0448-20130528/141197_1 /TAXON_ID=66468 /ORGANISM="Heterocapsa triquestra, Strain CCMP 448" /LENGTH=349 /DNA_ID=CAMNT_0040167297 /DNA_START=21 /DNA_END=1070 /DNA_ORIENTATION=+
MASRDRPWQQAVSSKRPMKVDAESEAEGGMVEVHACCLSESASAPAVLYCSLVGGVALALGRASPQKPHCPIRARLPASAILSCEGGDVVITGVLKRSLEDVGGEETDEPPAKVAKATASASPSRSPKAAPSSPAAQAPSPVAKAPVPVAKPSSPLAKAAAPSPKAPVPKAPVATAAAAKVAPPKAPEAKVAVANVAAPKAPEAKAAAAKVAAPKAPEAAAVEPSSKKKKKGQRERPEVPISTKVSTSGLRCDVMRLGTGQPAALGKKVEVKYEGRLASTGQTFDGGTIQFRLGLGEVIRGWDEGVKGMLRGEKKRLHVPSKLGYGTSGAPPDIPPNANLVFDVELLAC